jgi:hypothetical protein
VRADRLTQGLALGRLGFGAGMLLAPARLSRPWIGGEAAGSGTQVVVRSLGARDLVIGAGALVSRGPDRQHWLLAAVVSDATDLIASLAAGSALPLRGRILVGAAAGGAIAAGVLALGGLRDG